MRFSVAPFPASHILSFQQSWNVRGKEQGYKTYSTKRCRIDLNKSYDYQLEQDLGVRPDLEVHKQVGELLQSHMVPTSLPHTISRSQTYHNIGPHIPLASILVRISAGSWKHTTNSMAQKDV